MKNLLLSALAVFALGCSSARAADPLVAMQEAPVASWTGCYVGGNAGGGWSHIDQKNVGLVNGTIFDPPFDLGSGIGSGFVGGAQLGCDYQMDRWVFGVQGMFDFGDIKGSHVITRIPNLQF